MPQNIYTSGSVRGLMLKNALAMIPGTLAMSGYNVADTYFVGRLPGELPLAAMGFTLPVAMFVGCLFRGVAIGIMTTSAQSLGMNRSERAAKIVTCGVLLITLVSIVLGVAGALFGSPLLALCGAEGEALKMAQDYMAIWFLGCFTESIAITGNDVLIACGLPRVASSAMIGGMLLNVALDPLFIYGWGPLPGMGIRGAAIATIISQFASMAFTLGMLKYRCNLIRLERIPWKLVRHTSFLIIKYAVPAAAGMLTIPLGSGVVTRITSTFGDAAVAAANAGARIEMLAFVVPMSLGMGLTPFIAQNYGAKLYSRVHEARRFAMRFAAFFLIIFGVAIVIFRRYLAAFFADDVNVQEIMCVYLAIVPFGLWGVEIHRFAGFVFTGCARPNAGGLLNAMRIIVFLVPLSWLALQFDSLGWLFGARLAADVLSAAVAYILVRRMTLRLV